jgi:threonine 3-dehydrogenase
MGATHAWNSQEVGIVKAVQAETDGNGIDVLLEMSGHARALQQGLQEFDQAMHLIMQGECGKVILHPEPEQ